MTKRRVLRKLAASAFRNLWRWVHKPAEYVRTFDENEHLKQVIYLNPMYNYAPKNGG